MPAFSGASLKAPASPVGASRAMERSDRSAVTVASATGARTLSSTFPEIALVPCAEAAEAAARSARMEGLCKRRMRLGSTSEPSDSAAASYGIQGAGSFRFEPSFIGGALRSHPDRAGVVGAQRHAYDDDLHARAEPWRGEAVRSD